ncbi:trimeric intracellular cation channel family protein [Leptospira yasudae]|uniref:Trimeric intracellular cation channel family protein n=1 Tax=Leptospira yasudae TaxID=2202201 RepID=A0A5F2AV27_9LEPT|nr:trimeric intracellular cation channel family protein [Leptospira yasudae]MBW0432511.1 trimeric intracellular cation channel family protein [Leptospira yasudae]TGL82824.1 trimeric intracellular cation channel family protein [Leptospira yasudae]TGL83830.1 trimeric intracellular cation channel family protein [Leptospira yasudae]TGL83992.1 trimeric intracellular cation channel family protein [Leptospira yasudae]TGN01487.1 trimeric intracellular cation channel family protein [Leptospira yasudae]
MDLSYYIELTGVGFFAISGALAAAEKKGHHHDIFSAFFTGFITAIGGGTLRDITLGNYPVAWVRDENVLWAIFIGFIVTLLFARYWGRFRREMFLFDSIGIGIYTVIGTKISLAAGVNPFGSVILGMISAIFGGVIRDTLINEVPLIFRKEIYATACLAGATLYILLGYLNVNSDWNMGLSVLLVVTIRIVAVRFNLSLPLFRLPY